jgi:FKBP-type peptidyl-prolyl cis-trans isomerase
MNRATILATCALLAASGSLACKKGDGQATAPPADATRPQSTPPAGAAASGAAAAGAAGTPAEKKLPAPPDVKAPPADATRTASGLAYKILGKGTGGDKPGPADVVRVHYTGWQTNGEMFDSSVTRGQPAEFPLNQVIPGWTEGVQLLTKGDKARLWIPEALAYKGRPGAPQGMLVFDVELIDIVTRAPATPPDVKAPPADAKKTKAGVAYKILSAGNGKDKPRAWDRVKVNYSGWTTDGKMFDSSVTRGRPADIELARVIPGWSEGMQQVAKGDKARLWIPAELAYKDRPGAPQGMLVFDVELLEIERLPEPPAAPKDVAAPPKNAKKTEKGVFYKVLSPGKGKDHPKAASTVKVHYTGWTTDGKMFDSSVTRGQPASFPLSGVIPGWTDGLQTMVVGEKTRFWIPEELAYKGQPGSPQGMLVFDVELLEITN